MLPILFNKPFKTDGWPDENTTELIRLETLTFNTVYRQFVLCIYHNFVTREGKKGKYRKRWSRFRLLRLSSA